MSYRETDAPASTAAAADAVSKVKEAAAAEASNVSTTAAPISRWPWWATLLIALALLGVLVLFQALLWSYVSGTEESPESDDFDQLKAIADNIQLVVMLLVGAIFGVGATQGVVAGAAKAADDNRVAAEQASETANKNAVAVGTNLERADRFESATKDLATAIAKYKQARQGDESRFISSVRSFTQLTGSVQVPDSDVMPYDSELDRMAADAEQILQHLR